MLLNVKQQKQIIHIFACVCMFLMYFADHLMISLADSLDPIFSSFLIIGISVFFKSHCQKT